MGKRSRNSVPAPTRPAAGGRTGGARAATTAEAPPADGPIGRAKESWRVASEAVPKVHKEPGYKPRFDAKKPRVDRGPRPAALWGNAPVSELAILAGIVLLVVGFLQGPGSIAITGGLLMISVGALEFAGREHLRGYRSHSLFLAMILVILFHFALGLVLGADTARNSAFIALDVVLFVLIASALSKQFSIARLEAATKRSR